MARKFSSMHTRISALWVAQQGLCFYCKAKTTIAGKVKRDDKATIDHYIPLSKGGVDDCTNIVMSCNKCNREKKDKIPIHSLDKIVNGGYNVAFVE